MRKTKILSLFMAVVILCSTFAGCSLFGGKTVMKIGGNAISEDVYASAMILADSTFQQNMGFSLQQVLNEDIGDGRTGADFLKEQTDSVLHEFETIRIFAEKNGIKLDREDKKAMEESKKEQIEAAGGRKAYLEELKENGTSEAASDYFAEIQQLYIKVYTELFTGDGEYAPKIEEVAKLLSDGYVRVKHVLVLSSEGDEAADEKKAKAEDIAKRAKAGEDFDKLIEEFGEDPGMESSPEGYVIDAGGYTPSGSKMVDEFSAASNDLEVDEVSDIVKTTHGYHIIKRYPLTEEYVKENEATYVDQFSFIKLKEEMTKVMQEAEIEHTKAYEDIDVHAVFGVEKTYGTGADTGEHYEGDGHDHSAESAPEQETAE